jgi:ketosteroid isomerase-like protein
MLTRRALALSALSFALAGASGLRAHPHHELNAEQHGDIERQIMAVRAAIKDAIAGKDVTALRRLYAESFTHTHGSGKMDGRDARMVALLAGDPVIETAKVEELSLRVHGPDLAIVTGRSPILNSKEGRAYDFRWMQVYTRASGEWQLAASQATRLPTTS